MFKKAQAAMEFLMTYGWAILVVLAAIGALAYFGVLSPGNLLPQKCEFSSGVDCTETPVALSDGAGAGTLTIALTNSNGYDIDFTGSAGTVSGDGGSVACTLTTIADFDPVTNADWTNGETAIVTFDCTALPSAGSRFKAEVSFNYDSRNSGMTHYATGTVAGKVAE